MQNNRKYQALLFVFAFAFITQPAVMANITGQAITTALEITTSILNAI